LKRELLSKTCPMTGSVLFVMRKKNTSLKPTELYHFDLCRCDRRPVDDRSPVVAGHLALKSFLALFLCSLLLLPSPSWGFSKNTLRSQGLLDARELVTQSDAVLGEFLQDPHMKWLRKNIGKVRGIFVIPQMFRGTFLIGKSSGLGVLLARDPVSGKWSYPGFYTIDSVSTGLQIGADASEIVLLVMTEQGMQAMLESEFKIDSHIVVAAGPRGKGTAQHSADILAYARSMRGVISGVSLGGSVIAPHGALNIAFYGKAVSLEDILLRQVVSNYKAGPLRRRIIAATASLPSFQK